MSNLNTDTLQSVSLHPENPLITVAGWASGGTGTVEHQTAEAAAEYVASFTAPVTVETTTEASEDEGTTDAPAAPIATAKRPAPKKAAKKKPAAKVKPRSKR